MGNKGAAPRSWPFAQHLRELRASYGWSQSDLARRVGCSPSFINRLENGRRLTPGYAMLYHLVAELGCSPYDVLGVPFGRRALPKSSEVAAELERERPATDRRTAKPTRPKRKTA